MWPRICLVCRNKWGPISGWLICKPHRSSSRKSLNSRLRSLRPWPKTSLKISRSNTHRVSLFRPPQRESIPKRPQKNCKSKPPSTWTESSYPTTPQNRRSSSQNCWGRSRSRGQRGTSRKSLETTADRRSPIFYPEATGRETGRVSRRKASWEAQVTSGAKRGSCWSSRDTENGKRWRKCFKWNGSRELKLCNDMYFNGTEACFMNLRNKLLVPALPDSKKDKNFIIIQREIFGQSSRYIQIPQKTSSIFRYPIDKKCKTSVTMKALFFIWIHKSILHLTSRSAVSHNPL